MAAVGAKAAGKVLAATGAAAAGVVVPAAISKCCIHYVNNSSCY